MSKNTAVSSFNMESISTSEFQAHLGFTFDIGGNLLVVGRRGTGKTVITKKVIQDKKLKEVYVNLSTFERPDLGGYPNVFGAEKSRKYVDYLLPKIYESLCEGNQECILVLDEVDKVDHSIQAPLLEITQFRTINGQPLKNLKAVVMTANFISEGGNKPFAPLLDRCEKYILQANVSEWIAWAGMNSIHPAVIAFIKDHPDSLFGEIDLEENYSDSSPRSWAQASNILTEGEKRNISENILLQKVSGCIGVALGTKFMVYYKHYVSLSPLIENVIFNWNEEVKNQFEKLNSSQKIVVTFAVMSRVASSMDNFFKIIREPRYAEIAQLFGKISDQYASQALVSTGKEAAYDLSNKKANEKLASFEKSADHDAKVICMYRRKYSLADTFLRFLYDQGDAELAFIAVTTLIQRTRFVSHGLISYPNWLQVTKT